MSVQIPSDFGERTWDGSDGERYAVTPDNLPSFTTGTDRRTVPPFDLLVSTCWDPLPLAVGPRVELTAVLDQTPVGPILTNIVIESTRVSVAVGHGDAPDVFVRFSSLDLLAVRAKACDFLSIFQAPGATIEGDDAVLLYLAGLFDDELWTGHWGVSETDLAAAADLNALLAVTHRR